MKTLLLIATLALAACAQSPIAGQIVDVGPGPHMTTAHPAYTACGAPPAESLGGGKYRC